jgi:hypothetical protein
MGDRALTGCIATLVVVLALATADQAFNVAPNWLAISGACTAIHIALISYMLKRNSWLLRWRSEGALHASSAYSLSIGARCLPLCDAAFLISGHLAIRERWPQAATFAQYASNPTGAALWHLPLLVCSAALLYGGYKLATSPVDAIWRMGNRVYYGHLAVGVWTLTAVYYFLLQLCGAPFISSVFGNSIAPLRFLVEPVVATPAILAMYFCTYSVVVQSMPPGEATLAWRTAHNATLYRSLLLQLLMMSTAALATYLRMPRYGIVPNVALAAATFLSFYMNLVTQVSWLRSAAAVPKLDPKAAATFRGFSYYLVVVWHLHPLTWHLAVMGFLSLSVEHVLWFISDVCTKTVPLLLLIYFAATTEGGQRPISHDPSRHLSGDALCTAAAPTLRACKHHEN